MRQAVLSMLAVVVFGWAFGIAAAQSPDGIVVERAWARASIGTSRPAAAYLTLVNTGGEATRLVGIQSSVAGRVEVHRTFKEGDILRMEPADNVELPPGRRVVFEPGGLHVMLMDLKQPLKTGEKVSLILRFAHGRVIEVTAPVMALGARGPGG